MAYQAKRSKKLTKEFQLVDKNGNVAKTLIVKLDADDMVAKIHRKYTELCKALAEATEMKRKARNAEEISNCIEVLGRAVISMFEAVFGEEDTKIIVEFYENRYMEMCKEVVPFIKNVVIPRANKIKKMNQKNTLKPYFGKR